MFKKWKKSSNFGMVVSSSIATPWIHGADPINLLYWDKVFLIFDKMVGNSLLPCLLFSIILLAYSSLVYLNLVVYYKTEGRDQ